MVRILTIVALTSHPTVAQHQIDSGDDVDLAGVWQAENYILMDGTEHPVVGKIFFTENDWTVRSRRVRGHETWFRRRWYVHFDW